MLWTIRQRGARWQPLERVDGYLETVAPGIFIVLPSDSRSRDPDCIFEFAEDTVGVLALGYNIAERLLGPSGVALVWTTEGAMLFVVIMERSGQS